MWFWVGSRMDPKKIRNVAKYNRANGIMRMVYSIPFWLLFEKLVPGPDCGHVAPVQYSGLLVLILCYQHILE